MSDMLNSEEDGTDWKEILAQGGHVAAVCEIAVFEGAASERGGADLINKSK